MAVAKDPQSLTPELHERFWSLAARSNTGAETLVDQIAQSHLPYYKYLCIYYEDALESLSSGKAVKSEKRLASEGRLPGYEVEQWAKRMEIDIPNSVSRGAGSTTALVADMDRKMEFIAAHRPVVEPGVDTGPLVVLDEESIEARLGFFQASVAALLLLFAEPDVVEKTVVSSMTLVERAFYEQGHQQLDGESAMAATIALMTIVDVVLSEANDHFPEHEGINSLRLACFKHHQAFLAMMDELEKNPPLQGLSRDQEEVMNKEAEAYRTSAISLQKVMQANGWRPAHGWEFYEREVRKQITGDAS